MGYDTYILKCDDWLGNQEQYILRDSVRISRVEPRKLKRLYV